MVSGSLVEIVNFRSDVSKLRHRLGITVRSESGPAAACAFAQVPGLDFLGPPARGSHNRRTRIRRPAQHSTLTGTSCMPNSRKVADAWEYEEAVHFLEIFWVRQEGERKEVTARRGGVAMSWNVR